MGIAALVPFRDRFAGTHECRSADAGTDAAVGRGARLHRDVGCARDRHAPRRIRAWGGATCRGDTIDCCRLARLAQAARCRFLGAPGCASPSRVMPPVTGRSTICPSADVHGQLFSQACCKLMAMIACVHEWIFSPFSSIWMNLVMLRARVSALFTVWILNSIAYRFRPSSVSKSAFAAGLAFSAA